MADVPVQVVDLSGEAPELTNAANGDTYVYISRASIRFANASGADIDVTFPIYGTDPETGAARASIVVPVPTAGRAEVKVIPAMRHPTTNLIAPTYEATTGLTRAYAAVS